MLENIERIFICGDIHGELEISKLNTSSFPEQKQFKDDNNIVFQIGDFGIIWKNDPDNTEKHWLKWLDSKPWYTLFISGNHDNHDRLDKYPVIDFYGGKASQISEKVYHLKSGYVFNIANKKFFVFGGAESVDKELRIEGRSWWRQEIPDYKTMQLGLKTLEDNNWTVDYMLTHTLPHNFIHFLDEHRFGSNVQYKYNDPVAKYLDNVFDVMKGGYARWFFGHFHLEKNLPYNLQCLYNNIVELGYD